MQGALPTVRTRGQMNLILQAPSVAVGEQAVGVQKSFTTIDMILFATSRQSVKFDTMRIFVIIQRNSLGIKTLSLQVPSSSNCSLAGGIPWRSWDQVHLAPYPDRLEGASHPPQHLRRMQFVFRRERRIVFVAAIRWHRSEDAVRPFARQAVDEVGKLLAHTTTRVDHERHATAHFAIRNHFCILHGLVGDTRVDDTVRVDVGTVENVELGAHEVPHRHVAELPIAVNGIAREPREDDIGVERMAIRVCARAAHTATNEARNASVARKSLHGVGFGVVKRVGGASTVRPPILRRKGVRSEKGRDSQPLTVAGARVARSDRVSDLGEVEAQGEANSRSKLGRRKGADLEAGSMV